MNEQKAPKGIEWTRVYGRRGFTWNAIAGCKHLCRWTMPDGSVAKCYAETQAESPRLKPLYPGGFGEHYTHPKRLNEPLKVKEPAGIFLDSMSDLWGAWVPDPDIQGVLNTVKAADWHIFQSLTKNPVRMVNWQKSYGNLPANLWAGASVPPSAINGHDLKPKQQARKLKSDLRYLQMVNVPIRWMSFEPLSFDVAPIVAEFPGVLQWAVIGAASNGHKTFQPEHAWTQNLLDVLDKQGVACFFKGNLEWSPWRENFPVIAPPAPAEPAPIEVVPVVVEPVQVADVLEYAKQFCKNLLELSTNENIRHDASYLAGLIAALPVVEGVTE